MLAHFLKVGIRNFWKHRLYNIINIIGLSLGSSCFIGIMAFAINEFSYDKHHDNYENIFRLKLIGNMSGTEFEAAVTGAPVSKILYDELPEVLSYTRLIQKTTNALLEYNDKKLYQDNILYVDSLFLDMFNFNVEGDIKKALKDPYSVVLTESAAKKIFGNENPIGKFIKLDNDIDYTVDAVIKEPIDNTHLKFQMLISRASLYSSPRYNTIYNNMYAFTNMGYIKCSHNRIDELNEKIQNIFESHVGKDLEESGASLVIQVQPLKDIHLKSNIIHELDSNGDIINVYIFIAFAFLILIISSINYINLSIASSFNRTLEVGLRKMFGSSRKLLIIQFLTETFFITLISILLSLIILYLISPVFDSLVNRSFGFILYRVITWPSILALTIIITLLAGTYPSYHMSLLKPIKTLKGKVFQGNQYSVFRNSMIVLQFVISICLLSSTWFINRQMNYINSKDLGFNPSGLVNISLRDSDMISRYDYMKDELFNIKGVLGCSASSSLLGEFNQRREFYRAGKLRSEMLMIMNLQCEDNFLDLLDVEIIKGRNFYKDSKADFNKVIVNESFINKFGMTEPIGKVFRTASAEDPSNDPKYEIIGVCEDFHFASLHQSVEPLIIWKDKLKNRYLSVKIESSNTNQVISEIKKKWDSVFPNYPFEYTFLEDRYKSLYESDFSVNKVFKVFTLLSLLIACLGIFGLTSFSTEKRVKEIGIRKVLGAYSRDIIKLISREFIILIFISAIISVPITWFVIDKWLENFAFKIEIDWFIFIISSVFTMIVALVFINIRAIIAANKNPVDSLKYE